MSNTEHERRSQTVLERKVKKIAVAWCTIHIIGFIGEILFNTQKYGISQDGHNWYESKTIFYIAIETMVGLISSVCLFIGATKRQKYLLIPFMLSSIVALLFFLGIFIMYIVNYISIKHSGLMMHLFAMALLLILICTQAWMLNITQKYYTELSKKHNRDVVEDLPCATANPFPATAPSQSDVLGYAPMNHAIGQTSQRTPSTFNENENSSIQPMRPELPPAYSDTVVVSRDSNDKAELPPSYDDAMAMKNKDIEGDLV